MPLNISPSQVAFNARGDGKFNKPFVEQVDFFQQKQNLPTERYDDILKSAHDRAFVVAGAMKADLLDDFRQAVDRAIADGKSIGWFRSEFDNIVAKHGWTGWTGEGTKDGRDWRTRVIYRTNLSTSYAAGRWQQLNDPDLLKRRPYWKYIHNDTVRHPRPLHESWSGLVLRYDDPFWQTHFPPNGWGCQCRITAVRPSEYKGNPAPDDGTYIYKSKNGDEHVLPKGLDYGWNYAPGANKTTPLKDIVDQKLIRFPASIGADMWLALKPAMTKETTLQWYATLDDWLATPQAGRTAIVGAIAPSVLTWLESAKKITPVSAEIAVREGLIRGSKQIRHEKAGDGLTDMEWRQLPSIIGGAEQVLFDTQTGKLLYILKSQEAGIKLAVEFDYLKKGNPAVNMIVSGFRQATKTIEEKIRGGIYEVVE